MDRLESQPFPADSKQTNLAAKRSAPKELNPARDNKRVKDLSTWWEQGDVKLPTPIRRVPFPDKVCLDSSM